MNITIRIDDALAERLEKERGDKSKSDFYREILQAYIEGIEAGMSKGEGKVYSKDYVLRLENEIEYIRQKLDETLRTLGQEQILHLQTQRKLTQPAEPKPRRWFEFWQR